MTAMARFTLLLLVLWLGVAVAAVVDLQKRIIGGKDCGEKERQYHVKLILNNKPSCGASLINDQWILTAAHCVPDGWSVKATLRDHPGTNPITVPIQDKDILRYFDNTIPHDIALLKLPQPVKPDDYPPVKLPECGNRPKLGDMVQVAGHGSTTMGPNQEKLKADFNRPLQCADIKIVKCGGNYVVDNRWHGHWICGKTPNVDTCGGDSGGGVVFKNMIYGVHSNSGTKACTVEAAFIDVCKYIPWIGKTILKNSG